MYILTAYGLKQFSIPEEAAPLQSEDDPERLKHYENLGLQTTEVARYQSIEHVHPDAKPYITLPRTAGASTQQPATQQNPGQLSVASEAGVTRSAQNPVVIESTSSAGNISPNQRTSTAGSAFVSNGTSSAWTSVVNGQAPMTQATGSMAGGSGVGRPTQAHSTGAGGSTGTARTANIAVMLGVVGPGHGNSTEDK